MKWDGVRTIVATGDDFRVRTAGARDIAMMLPELRGMPGGLILDGQLMALDDHGCPSQPRLCRRALHGDHTISIVYIVFDLLEIDGEDLKRLRYVERRELVEELDLHGPHWHTPPYTLDGEDLLRYTLAHGLEGIVAKRLQGAYRPGRRDWITITHRSSRVQAERESMRRSVERRVRFARRPQIGG